MKKLIIALIVLILMPLQVGAVNKKATLINDNGSKIVINVGDKFPKGFRLYVEPKLGIALPQNMWVRKNLVGTSASLYDFNNSSSTMPIATSTSVMSGDFGFDTLSLNIKVVNASTTGANTITIVPTFSNEDGCGSSTDSSINWFSNYNELTQLSTSTSFAANATTLKKYDMFNLATQCTKLVISSSHASSTIWVQGLLK